MKTIFTIMLVLLGTFITAQQNPEFKEIKNYFDSQKQLLKTEFQKKYHSETNPLAKEKIKKDFYDFMQKIDSVRNTAYIGALIRIKNNEDLHKVASLKDDLIKNKKIETPEFPNGINSLREKIASLFYSEGISTEDKELNTIISFVVEKDGSISEIRADGETPAFNKQAEIALYLLPEKFEKPGTIDGNAVRYQFRMPLRMRIE